MGESSAFLLSKPLLNVEPILRENRRLFVNAPELGALNVEPTQNVIRNLFLERITDMKGFRNVKRAFDNQFVPTPVAVLTAGELLNKGTDSCQGLGPLMIVDVGGATTDVYSFNENKSYEGAKLVGLAEPFGKRTVEGDLGATTAPQASRPRFKIYPSSIIPIPLSIP